MRKSAEKNILYQIYPFGTLDNKRVIMIIDDILALVVADESRTLELKKPTGEVKDDMRAACAFLKINYSS